MIEKVPEAPLPETVKELVKTLEQDGVDSGYGAGGPSTKVLDGIQAMGKEWVARLGYGFNFPNKVALTIWENNHEKYYSTPRGYFDSLTGERCNENGEVISGTPQKKYELNQNEIEELVAAFQAQGTSEKVQKQTIETWQK